MTVTTLARCCAAAALTSSLAACGNDPGRPLIPVPEGRAVVVDPASVPLVTDDGFPNVLASPVALEDVPPSTEEVAQREAALAARGASVGVAASRVPEGSSAAFLRRRGATHAEEARREIEETGRVKSP